MSVVSEGRERRHAIPVLALGIALSAFFALSFTMCVIGYYILPDLPIAHGALSLFLPGFQFNSFPRFLIGLGETIAWGWYIAVVFGTLYNLIAARFYRLGRG